MATPCIIQHRYRVDPLDRAQLLLLLADVRAHAIELGVAAFEAWQDQDDPWLWAEVHRFDSWGHFQRLTQKALDPHMLQTYEALAQLQVGGADAVETRIWTQALANE
jgi:hypothetical protein